MSALPMFSDDEVGGVRLERHWAMPDANTFQIPPVAALLRRVLAGRKSIVDPFARASKWATWANDLDASFGHAFALEARDFARELKARNVVADAILFDPPYSPRQIAECYRGIGRGVTMEDTQLAGMVSELRDLLTNIAGPGCLAVSFGWNSVGFGKSRHWRQTEIHLVCHGGGHNDTICTVEVYR